MCTFLGIVTAWRSNLADILRGCNRITLGDSDIHQLSVDCFESISHDYSHRRSMLFVLADRLDNALIGCQYIFSLICSDQDTRIATIRTKCLEVYGCVHAVWQDDLSIYWPYERATFVVGIRNNHTIFIDDHAITACLCSRFR